MVLTQNLAAKWIRYGCTLSILRADSVKKSYFFKVFRTNFFIPKNKVQDPKIKYKSQNFETCTLFFALNFIDSYPVRWLWRDPRIKSTPTLCFSTSGTHRTLVKSYRHIAPAKRFDSYFHFATLNSKVPTQGLAPPYVLKTCTRNLGGSWHGRCGCCQEPNFLTEPQKTVQRSKSWQLDARS